MARPLEVISNKRSPFLWICYPSIEPRAVALYYWLWPTENCPNLIQQCPSLYIFIKSFHCPVYQVETKSPLWCETWKSYLRLPLPNVPTHFHWNTVFSQVGASKKLCVRPNNAALTWNMWELPYWNSLRSLWDTVLYTFRQLLVFWWGIWFRETANRHWKPSLRVRSGWRLGERMRCENNVTRLIF